MNDAPLSKPAALEGASSNKHPPPHPPNLAVTTYNPAKLLRRLAPSSLSLSPFTAPSSPSAPARPPTHAAARRPAHNTAKLSPTALFPPRPGLTFAEPEVTVASTPPPLVVQNAERKITMNTHLNAEERNRRRRRSSSLMYQEPPESLEQQADQATMPNLNAQWVNAKGAWMIHIILISLLKILFDILPSISQEASWTLTNTTYMFGSYLMFHWVRGVPFEFNAGAYDNLNMWEQMDNGDQYTPAKKFLLAVPICLFLVSTHYTHYGLWYFLVNLAATLAVVVPKLPALHRMRFALFNPDPDDTRR